MTTEIWLLITAIVFTFVGMSFRRTSKDYAHIVIEATIDKLIEDGFIKTRKDDKGQIELLKYYEE